MPTSFASRDEIVAWMYDEGWFDGARVERAADGVEIAFVTELLEAPPAGDPRWSFRRTTKRVRPFVLRGAGKLVAAPALPADVHGYDVRDDGGGIALVLQLSTGDLVAAAPRWQLDVGAIETRAIERHAAADTITFYLTTPLATADIVAACARHGVAVEVRGSDERRELIAGGGAAVLTRAPYHATLSQPPEARVARFEALVQAIGELAFTATETWATSGSKLYESIDELRQR